MQDWEIFEKSLEGPSDAFNPRHVDIMGPLYSHQAASPTVAKQFDTRKLWETRIEKDTNFAGILHKLHHNVQTKQQEKKSSFIQMIYNSISHRFSSWTESEIKTGNIGKAGNFTYQFNPGAKFLRQKAAQNQFPHDFSTKHTLQSIDGHLSVRFCILTK